MRHQSSVRIKALSMALMQLCIVMTIETGYAADEEEQIKALSILLESDMPAASELIPKATEARPVLPTSGAKALFQSLAEPPIPQQEYSEFYDNAPTRERLQRFHDQHINAPARISVRAGQTAQDNHHSEFSTRAHSTAVWNRHIDELNKLKSDLYTRGLSLQMLLDSKASEINSLHDSIADATTKLDGATTQREIDDTTNHIQKLRQQLAKLKATGGKLAQNVQSLSDQIKTKELMGPTPAFAEQGYITAGALGRAAVITDSARMGSASPATFQPSQIPVSGQPFFQSPAQTNVQGSGSLLTLQAGTSTGNSKNVAATTVFTTNVDMLTGNTSLNTQQAYLQYDWLMAGLAETGFADNDALPETLDLAGPNARVTVFENGLASGQARATAFLFSPEDHGAGATAFLSVEQAVPEIQSTVNAKGSATSNVYSRIPDFIGTWRYVDGTGSGNSFDEWGHVQVSSLVRDLGQEFSSTAIGTNSDIYGWGLSLSGHRKFVVDPTLHSRDSVYFSVTGGEGVAHYINDLHSPSLTAFGNDDAINSRGQLAAIPAVACYTGYTHNWNDRWRSTVTYSRVDLNSMQSQGAFAYKSGQYVGANLLNHVPLNASVKGSQSIVDGFYWGVEYLYGDHTTLNHASADLQRVMLVVSFNGSQKASK